MSISKPTLTRRWSSPAHCGSTGSTTAADQARRASGSRGRSKAKSKSNHKRRRWRPARRRRPRAAKGLLALGRHRVASGRLRARRGVTSTKARSSSPRSRTSGPGRRAAPGGPRAVRGSRVRGRRHAVRPQPGGLRARRRPARRPGADRRPGHGRLPPCGLRRRAGMVRTLPDAPVARQASPIMLPTRSTDSATWRASTATSRAPRRCTPRA